MTTKEDLEDTSAPLMDHLIELRQRLMYAIVAVLVLFLICFYFATEILDFLIIPYKWGSGVENPELFFTALQEVFFVEVRIAFFGAIFIGFPIIATQLYKFIAPGLYSNEKGAFLPFLIATPVLFFLGGCLVYFFVMPSAVYFFLSFQREAIDAGDTSIQNLLTARSYLDLIMLLIFAFGLAFQLPVALTLLVKAGLVSAQGLAEKRKYSILLSFVAAAVLTPPDPLSQIGLALSIIALYEVSIIIGRKIEKKRKEREDAEESDNTDVVSL